MKINRKIKCFLEIFLIIIPNIHGFAFNMLDTVNIKNFITSWAHFSDNLGNNPQWVSMDTINFFYADSVLLYGENYDKTQLIHLFAERTFFYQDYGARDFIIRQEVVRGTDCLKIIFSDSCGYPMGYNALHNNYYLIVRGIGDGHYKIIRESSYTFDIWNSVKEEIHTHRFIDQFGKNYYIINVDSTAFQDFRVLILTDSFNTTFPTTTQTCGGESVVGFGFSGPIYVALVARNGKKIFRISKVNFPSSNDSKGTLINYGFPCLVYGKDRYSSSTIQYLDWYVPSVFQWKQTKNNWKCFELISVYENGDHCSDNATVISINSKKKMKIEY